MHERKQRLLTALLQELGAVLRRIGRPPDEYLKLLPVPFQEELSACLSEQPESSDSQPKQLVALAAQIDLKPSRPPRADNTYYYPLQPLSFDPEDFMPGKTAASDIEADYDTLWNEFRREMHHIQGQTDFDAYFFTLYFLLKKYFARVPSAAAQDISVFDQARVTAALADCRYCYELAKGETTPAAPEFLLIEGDVSGIQNFISSMIAPQQEQAGLAKRLRGRSFYLWLLTETLADYLLTKLDLKIVSILWCGGGHFLLLAPNTEKIEKDLKTCYEAINQFLVTKFHGDLGCVLSWVSASKNEIDEHFDVVRRRLAANTDIGKRQKLWNVLNVENNLHFPSEPAEDRGEFGAAADKHIETLHKEQERIGKRLGNVDKGFCQLVKASYAKEQEDHEAFLTKFLIEPAYQIAWFIDPDRAVQPETVYWLNEYEKFWGSGLVKYGFKLVATHVDTYTDAEARQHNQQLIEHGADLRQEGVDAGDIKQFGDLAETGKGGFLGVLRMDVDNLGAVFSIGLRDRQTLARVAALSSEFDLFFTGYLQQLCQSDKFKKNIYVAYSGGDDLFIVGAWDRMVELACQIRADFKAFTCHHPDMNISAGIAVCKGKYPISRAAEQAKDLLDDLAKENEPHEENLSGEITQRDAIAIFNHRMEWDDFIDDLKKMGDKLVTEIERKGESKKLNRTYLYKLLDLHQTWKAHRQLNIARLFYITVRNIENTIYRQELLDHFKRYHTIGGLKKHIYLENPSYIPILIGYTALKTRKRG